MAAAVPAQAASEVTAGRARVGQGLAAFQRRNCGIGPMPGHHHQINARRALAQARQQLKARRFDAVITDMRLPDGLGLELLRELIAEQRPERCVVITAHGSAENAVEALKSGAFDYLTKPVDLKQFRSVVASAIQGTRTIEESARHGSQGMRALDSSETSSAPASIGPSRAIQGAATKALDKLVGQSAGIQLVKARIQKVAGSMAPILIQGESGTGKELVASAVHGCSHRAAGPFIAVNCGAIPENLMEAEFFGARKGAYTGSTQDRVGYFQAAKGGTLFLDEIGDLPLAMQSKLLRAIQERVVRPLGSSHEDTVDVRVVSASHKELGAEVTAGRFRQDLYYRLNVIVVAVPPLRERLEDLPELCDALLARICRESGIESPHLSTAVLAQLRAQAFPGNVRELENILHRAVALSEGGQIHLDVPPAEYVAVPENLQDYLDAQERSILSKVLQECRYNRTAAAVRLGLTLRQMRYRITRLNIPMPDGDNHADGSDGPDEGP